MARILEQARDESLPSEVWFSLDIDFHRAVAESSSNRVLLVPLAALHALVQPRLNDAIRPLVDRSKINAQHQAIHDAIHSHDVSAAGAAVDRHLDHLERLYRRSGVL
jgi:DNA-binding FadR family transcriptional regulator